MRSVRMKCTGKSTRLSAPVPMSKTPTLNLKSTVRTKTIHLQTNATKDRTVEAIKTEEPSPFFEPLIRSLVVGVGVGAVCETVHTLLKMWDYFTSMTFVKLSEAYPDFLATFSPWFVGDHVAAVSVCAFVYSIEVLAVLAMVQQSSSSATNTQPKLVESLLTLPKRLLPWKFTPVKALVSKITGPRQTPSKPPSILLSTGIASNDIRRLPITTLHATTAPLVNNKPDLESPWRRRQQELVERESYLTNFWYAAALSEKVTEEPLGVEILSMKVVLFRDESGKVHCLKDVCPHRSAPLSKGWMSMKNGEKCIVCPYHGWAFDKEGEVKHIPTTDKLPVHSGVESFVVEELGGFVWLFYEHPFGPKLPVEERPPIPYTPEFDHPNWRASYSEIEFDCGHWAVFENATDLAHIHYLHGDSFGNASKPRIENLKATTKDAFGVTATCNLYNKTVNLLWKFTEVDIVPVVAQAKLPSTSIMKITLGAGIEFITFVNTVPINKHRSINRFALLRNFLPWPSKVWDPWARSAMLKILSQDKKMVEQLTPELSSYDVSVDVDLLQTSFRKLRHDYFSMGYGFHPINE
eukprot:g8979.t1